MNERPNNYGNIHKGNNMFNFVVDLIAKKNEKDIRKILIETVKKRLNNLII